MGASELSDEELFTILMGKKIPAALSYPLPVLVQMDPPALIQIKGIGQAKAATLLAATEFCRRVTSRQKMLQDEQACYAFAKALLAPAEQLQYVLLLISAQRGLLAFSEAGSVLPDMAWITGMAVEAGAGRLLLIRNGWLSFSNAEGRYVMELRSACAALHIVCEGLMAVGPERFKMI
nr:hypothetical protein [Mucilaginibacter sp. PPCGB 2223]